jgi:MFS family permease
LFAVEPGPMDLSEAGFGLFLTAAAVGSVAGSWCAPRLEARLGRARTLSLTVVGMAAGTASPLLEFPLAVAAFFALNSLLVVAWNIITVSLRQRIVPDHLLGRVNAGYRLLAWGTMPIGAAMGGIIGSVFSLRWVFVAGAAMQLALLACFKVITDENLDAAS